MFNDHALTFGLVSAMRTGNLVVDVFVSTVICLTIPLIMGNGPRIVVEFFKSLFAKASKDLVERQIVAVENRNVYGDTHNQDKNHILQKAIVLHAFGDESKWSKTNPKAAMKLVDPGIRHVVDEEDEEQSLATLQRQLANLALTTVPQDNDRVEIEPGLFFVHDKISSGEPAANDSTNKVTQTQTTTITISCTTPDARERVDAFVSKAFEQYQKMVCKKDRNERFMLTLASARHTKHSALLYVRYQLSDEKTFESLFLPRKADLLNLLDNFQDDKGKFAVKGFPRKLGLLLHGPPGTGKTSLIKAIAHYTNRHIVTIPLKRLQTNEQLMELMFGCKFNCFDEDLPLHIPLHKIVFTLEDVDAAGDVAADRSQTNLARQELLAARLLAATNAQQNGNLASKSDLESDLLPERFAGRDALDLAGLLNALDGVVDSPGRIVVMTTNHPEKLDPALVRPGRVNMKLNLGKLRTEEAEQMLAHYFSAACETREEEKKRQMKQTRQERRAETQHKSRLVKTLPKDAAEKLYASFPSGQVTPAFLEEKCAESESLADILEAIADKNFLQD